MLALALLLPGHVGDDEQEPVEGERVAHVDRGDEVAHVRRVERAAEHADAFRHVTGSYWPVRGSPRPDLGRRLAGRGHRARD